MPKQEGSENKPKMFWTDSFGMYLNWKSITIVMALFLGGGGSYTGFILLPGDKIKGMIAASAQEIKASEDKRYKVLDSELAKYAKDLVTLTKIVKGMRRMQQTRWARDEARRITSPIRDRGKREEEYDRLVDLNMRRILHGEDPCQHLSCEVRVIAAEVN